jgi:hypothetical protein
VCYDVQCEALASSVVLNLASSATLPSGELVVAVVLLVVEIDLKEGAMYHTIRAQYHVSEFFLLQHLHSFQMLRGAADMSATVLVSDGFSNNACIYTYHRFDVRLHGSRCAQLCVHILLRSQLVLGLYMHAGTALRNLAVDDFLCFGCSDSDCKRCRLLQRSNTCSDIW